MGINGLSLAHSLLGNGSLLASPLRLILGDLAEFFRPRLPSLCLPSQSLGLCAFGTTLLRGSLCTLLSLLCASQGSFSLDAQPLSFTALSLLLLFASLHRRPYDEHEQHQKTRHDDYPKPTRHGVRLPGIWAGQPGPLRALVTKFPAGFRRHPWGIPLIR